VHPDGGAASGPGRLSYPAVLLTTGCVYAVVHHLGLLPGGLGAAPRGTRWTDWLDLLTPYVVLTPAAMTLVAAPAPRSAWLLLGLGGVAYASGHGIHLAANSVGNVEPGVTAHLWDEVVGHHVWFAGVALVGAALALTMRGRARPGHPAGYLVALAVGLTWASNAVGGGTVPFSLAVSLVAAGFGWTQRRGLGVVLLVGFVPAAVLLVVQLVTDLS
jgi:hypothetical protein